MVKKKETVKKLIQAHTADEARRKAKRGYSTLIFDSVKLKSKGSYTVTMHRRVKRLGQTRKFGGKTYLQREIRFNKEQRDYAKARAEREGWKVRVTPLGKSAYVVWVRK